MNGWLSMRLKISWNVVEGSHWPRFTLSTTWHYRCGPERSTTSPLIFIQTCVHNIALWMVTQCCGCCGRQTGHLSPQNTCCPVINKKADILELSTSSDWVRRQWEFVGDVRTGSFWRGFSRWRVVGLKTYSETLLEKSLVSMTAVGALC